MGLTTLRNKLRRWWRRATFPVGADLNAPPPRVARDSEREADARAPADPETSPADAAEDSAKRDKPL